MLDKNQPYNKLSGKLVTPHIKWANPYCKGKLKALFIAPTLGQRETIELAQRLSLDYTALMTHDYHEMYQDPKWLPHAVPFPSVDKIVQKKLRKNHDLILIGKVSWKALPEYLREWISEQVEQGTGLVYVCPSSNEEIGSLFSGKESSDNESFVTDCAPLEVLPVLRELDKESIFRLNLHGKGRVVKINYGQQQWGELHSFTPAGEYDGCPLNYDYYHSILAKAAIWAARKESDIQIREMRTVGDSLTLKVTNKGAKSKNVQVEMLVRNRANQIENRQERNIILSEEVQEISFQLPPLKAGLHFLDLWVKEKGKTLNWQSTALTITAVCSIEKVVLDKESYQEGDMVKGKIVFGQRPDNKARLEIRLLDNFGRIMAEKALSALDKEVDFAFEIKESLSLLLKIKSELFVGEQTIGGLEKEFLVARKKLDDYFFAMWIGSAGNHLGNLALEQFQAHGVDFDYAYPSAERYHKITKANLGLIPYFSTSFFPGYGYHKMDQDALVRTPCFTDAAFRAKLKKELQQKAQLNKTYSQYYSLSINGGLSPLRCITPLDLCFSPSCQKHFQEYLKKEYQSLEALNKEWETDFKAWDEVRAMTFIQAKKHGNFAPWADHRLHMEQVFTEINTFSRDAVLEIDPDAVIGLDEPNVTSSYNGYDWPSLMRELDFCNPYFGKWHWRDDQVELARCFGKKQQAPRGIWFGSYWREEGFNRFIPWQSLFNGMNGLYWWVGIASRNSSIGALAPDFTPLPYYSQALEEINEIKRGIGKLLVNSARENDKIAIHYSSSSIHAATIEANAQLPPGKFPEEEIIRDCVAEPDTPTQFGSSYPLYRSQQSLMTVLEDIGLQYDFVTNEQIEAGELKKEGYKILMLPYAKALSQKEAVEIKAFVSNGGMAIADRLPGVMNEHCKKLEQSSLQELFADAETRLKVNHYGKGKAVCLHDFLDDYVFSLRPKGQEAEKREKVREILKLADVEAKLRITDASGKELGSTETVFFKNGDMEYACLLRDYLIEDNSARSVTLIFPREAHLYDLRSSKYHGLSKQVSAKLTRGQAKVFALSPYKVTGLQLSVAEAKYRQGETVSYKLDIQANASDLSTHMFRVELLNPEKQTVDYYSKNLLAENGSCSAALPLSLNEQAGKWSIRAKDLMSGISTEKTFLVESCHP